MKKENIGVIVEVVKYFVCKWDEVSKVWVGLPKYNTTQKEEAMLFADALFRKNGGRQRILSYSTKTKETKVVWEN